MTDGKVIAHLGANTWTQQRGYDIGRLRMVVGVMIKIHTKVGADKHDANMRLWKPGVFEIGPGMGCSNHR